MSLPATELPAASPAEKPIQRWWPWVGAAAVRVWGATWRLRTSVAPAIDPLRSDRTTRCIYLIWHRTILLACHSYRDLGICVGVSQHRDGEFAARIAAHLGVRTARGSSTRGAVALVREMLAFARRESGDLCMTPDGPKGPARQTKPGALFLAGHLGWPVVPIALTARPRKELKSWDRFILPAPFAKIGIVSGEPLVVPRRADDETLAKLCTEVDRRMAAAELVAEELVA